MKLQPLLVVALTCTVLFPSGNQPDNFTLPAEFDFSAGRLDECTTYREWEAGAGYCD
jgi:hypothetical protein